MKTQQTKYLTCAETAKLVRIALKAKFQGVKFSVRSSVYAGGASIYISYTNGPKADDVEKVAHLYEGATFDGSQDLKEYHSSLMTDANGNTEKVDFGADFIFVNRNYSPEYDRHLCRDIDLRDGKPALKPQFMCMIDTLCRPYPYIRYSYAIKNDGTCELESEQPVCSSERPLAALMMQGYSVSLLIENSKYVIRIK